MPTLKDAAGGIGLIISLVGGIFDYFVAYTLEMVTDTLNFLAQGGTVLYLLCLLSVAALTIILAKFWQLRPLLGGRGERAVEALLNGGGADGLPNNHPAVRAYLAAKDGGAKPLENAERSWRRDAKELEGYLPTLATIANVAPLLGLLGTVIGMIEAFTQLELSQGVPDPALLAGGIWKALLTTAFGLSVAIPASVALAYFERRLGIAEKQVEEVYRAFAEG